MGNLKSNITEYLSDSDVAKSYGEILGKAFGEDPFTATLGTKVVMDKVFWMFDVLERERIELKAMTDFYRTAVIPAINDLRREGKLKVYSVKKNPHNRPYSLFAFDEEWKLDNRLKDEQIRKDRITPTILNISKIAKSRIAEKSMGYFDVVFLTGYASPDNTTPFLYYGNEDKIMAGPSLNITFIVSNDFERRRFGRAFGEVLPDLKDIFLRRKVVVRPWSITEPARGYREDAKEYGTRI